MVIKGHPIQAKRDLETGQRDYKALVAPMNVLLEGIIRALSRKGHQDEVLVLLLKSMEETHESMRAILRDAERFEKESGQKTGRHFDAVLLARPQVETVFVGLLLLHDFETYLPIYRKAAWMAGARTHYYEHLRTKGTQTGEAWWRNQWRAHEQIASAWGVTDAEAKAALADLTDQTISSAEKKAMPQRFPDPSEITHDNKRLLAGSPLEALADLLWRQWKFLCDPAHVGLRAILLKAFLRGDSVGVPSGTTREGVISMDIHVRSIVVSAVSMIAFATAIVVSRFRNDHGLLAKCAEAWDPFRTGTVLGSLLWDGWARQALGILEPADR